MRATEDRDDDEMLLLLQEDLRTHEMIKTDGLGSLESRVVHDLARIKATKSLRTRQTVRLGPLITLGGTPSLTQYTNGSHYRDVL
jgi:hypothetical protein